MKIAWPQFQAVGNFQKIFLLFKNFVPKMQNLGLKATFCGNLGI